MSIDVSNIADGYDIGKQLLEAYQTADDKEKFLDELDSLKGSGAISNYNRDTFRAYANKGIVPNGNISVISNVGSTKDLTELYDKPVTDRQDKLHNLVQKGFDDNQKLFSARLGKIINLLNDTQKEFDDTQVLVENEFNETQELVQREFNETQDNLNTNTNKIINNDNANHASLISDLDSNTDKIIANDNANLAVATAKWDKLQDTLTAKLDKIISILTVLSTNPSTEEDKAEVSAAS